MQRSMNDSSLSLFLDTRTKLISFPCPELKQSLAQEVEARIAAEEALKTERIQRLRAERLVEDIRKEQASPFVVPALMDAFVKIAQMSDTALGMMELNGQDSQMDCS